MLGDEASWPGPPLHARLDPTDGHLTSQTSPLGILMMRPASEAEFTGALQAALTILSAPGLTYQPHKIIQYTFQSSPCDFVHVFHRGR